MASVGALTIDLQAQTASFQADMGRAARAVQTNTAQMNRSLKTLQTGFTGLQTIIGRVAPLLGVGFGVGFLKSVLDTVGGLGELSEQLGVSTDLIQSMQFAAVQAGVSTKELETGLGRLTRSIGEAANGEKEFLDEFERLGIGVLDFNGKVRTTESVLREFAQKLMGIEDPARRAAAAAALMGRGGQRLLPLLSQGAAGIDQFVKSAKDAGMVLDSELITRFDTVSDRLARIGMMLTVETASHLDKWGSAWSKTVDDIIADLSRIQSGLTGIVTKPADVLNQWSGGALGDLGDFVFGRPARVVDQWLNGSPRTSLQFPDDEDPPLPTVGSFNPKSKDDPTAKSAEAAKKRIDELILSLEAEESQIGMTDRAREISQALFKAEAIARAGNIELTDHQRESIAYLTAKIAEGTDEQKRQNEALQSALDGLKVYNDAQDEIANNTALLQALQKGTKEYERQAAYIAILNKYKAAGIKIDEQVKANAKEAAETLGDQRDSIDKLKNKYSEWERVASDATRVISTGLEDAVLRGAKATDILSAALQDLARVLLRISVIKPFENWASDLAAANSAAGSSSGGGGGFLGSIFGAIGGLFGGGGGGAAASSGTAAGFTEGWFSSGMAFADGGRPPVGQASWVGEQGPEMFVPDVAGTIIPNDELGGRGDSYYIDARGADREGLSRLERMIRQVNGSIERRSVAAVSDARARNPRLLPA